MIDDINYDELDPGIRDTVRWLDEHGFETCDSGDGESKFEEGWTEDDGAMPFPHVIIHCLRENLVMEADRLAIMLLQEGMSIDMGEKPVNGNLHIQAMYNPGDLGASIMLVGTVDVEYPETEGGN